MFARTAAKRPFYYVKQAQKAHAERWKFIKLNFLRIFAYEKESYQLFLIAHAFIVLQFCKQWKATDI